MLNYETFSKIVEHAPLVSIDLILKDSQEYYLLGQRVNNPAEGSLFVPGGRIYKNETIEEAFTRILRAEVGDVEIRTKEFLGVYQHFYRDSFFGNQFGTHYVVLAYTVKIMQRPLEVSLLQHDLYLWLKKEDIILDARVHDNARDYFL